MGDLLGSVFGSARSTAQQQLPDPISQQMNILRYNQLQNLFGSAGFGSPLTGGGPFDVYGPYTPSPDVANLYNMGLDYLNEMGPLHQQYSDLAGQMPMLAQQMQGIGGQMAGFPQQFQQLYNQAMAYPAQMQQVGQGLSNYQNAINNLYNQSQQYPGMAMGIGAQLGGYPA